MLAEYAVLGEAALLRSAPRERAKIVQELVDQVIVDDKRIMIKMQRGALFGVEASLCASEEPSGSTMGQAGRAGDAKTPFGS